MYFKQSLGLKGLKMHCKSALSYYGLPQSFGDMSVEIDLILDTAGYRYREMDID